MNRRGFLRALGTAATVGVVAPAALAELLVPKRTIFLPPRGGWLLDKVWYTDEVAYIQTAIGAELDKLFAASYGTPIYYTDAGFEMIEARINFVLRKYGETDAQLRERMFLKCEGWPADKVFEV